MSKAAEEHFWYNSPLFKRVPSIGLTWASEDFHVLALALFLEINGAGLPSLLLVSHSHSYSLQSPFRLNKRQVLWLDIHCCFWSSYYPAWLFFLERIFMAYTPFKRHVQFTTQRSDVS